MKRLLTTTALGLILMTAPAVAQTDKDQSPAAQQPPQTQMQKPDAQLGKPETQMQKQPSQTQDQTGLKPSETEKMAQPDAATKADKLAEPRITTEQSGKQALASELIGKSVTNVRGESVGEINDLVVDETGKVASVIVGVGGFLGLGEKSVAIDFADLQFSHRDDNTILIVAMTQQELEALPAWESADTKSTGETPAADQTPASKDGLQSETEKKKSY